MDTTEEEIDAYIPVRQIVKEWGVNKEFVLREIKKGTLQAYRFAGAYRIRRSVLDAYLEARRVQPLTGKEVTE